MAGIKLRMSTSWITPALVVYPDRIKRIFRLAVEMVGDPAFLRRMSRAQVAGYRAAYVGGGYSSFKVCDDCGGEMLAMVGAPDVLLAYQPIGPKAVRLAALIRKYPGGRGSLV